MARNSDDTLRRQILSLLRTDSSRAFQTNEVADRLDVDGTRQYNRLKGVLGDLKEEGEVDVIKGGRVQHLPDNSNRGASGHTSTKTRSTKARSTKKGGRDNGPPTHASTSGDVGTLSVIASGAAFVTFDDGSEAFVPPPAVRPALNGDRVRVEITKKSRGGERLPEGRVTRVVERMKEYTVGTFDVNRSAGWVSPDDDRLPASIYVPKEAWNGASPRDKVVVSLDAWEDGHDYPEGRVLSVLGPADAPGVDVLSVAMAYGAPGAFPEEVEREAEEIPLEIPQSVIDKRKDYRFARTFTIDPDDAKDFDDAIHIRQSNNGVMEVGVHIADVSHYVKPGTALDAEALSRATSTYLVDRTIPMLPEKLSNGVCSLRPREDKLAYSCIMEITPDGEVVSSRIEETVIHSKERFTYDHAQAILDGNAGHELAEDVRMAGKLARTLTRKRMEEGAIDFDVPEIKIILNDHGEPVDIIHKERKPANRLIEEFMLLANRTVAWKGTKQKKPFVYRIHDHPDRERIQQLADYVRSFGLELPVKDGVVRREALNNLLKQAKSTKSAPVIEQSAIRSMSKAIYSTKNIGHYGLGFEHYSHFTSPIRRYPDLIAHRLLKSYFNGGTPADREHLEATCQHCSEREQEATKAERESVKLKQVEYAVKHVGDAFDGVVTGVTKFGVFVEMEALLVEGLVHVREMDGYWEYNAERYELKKKGARRGIRTGDSCRVKIAAADPESRQVDLLFETLPTKTG